MIEFAGIKIYRLRDGGRRLVHPSGVVVTERPADIIRQRMNLMTEIADRQAELMAIDDLAVRIGQEVAI